MGSIKNQKMSDLNLNLWKTLLGLSLCRASDVRNRNQIWTHIRIRLALIRNNQVSIFIFNPEKFYVFYEIYSTDKNIFI